MKITTNIRCLSDLKWRSQASKRNAGRGSVTAPKKYEMLYLSAWNSVNMFLLPNPKRENLPRENHMLFKVD